MSAKDWFYGACFVLAVTMPVLVAVWNVIRTAKQRAESRAAWKRLHETERQSGLFDEAMTEE